MEKEIKDRLSIVEVLVLFGLYLAVSMACIYTIVTVIDNIID